MDIQEQTNYLTKTKGYPKLLIPSSETAMSP